VTVLLLMLTAACRPADSVGGSAPTAAAAAGRAGETADDAAQRPRRVVSLDYCADQFVLALVDRADIAAVSPDAADGYSYLRDRARGLPTVRPVAEDVLVLGPDVVVRSYGGGPQARRFFEGAGVEVVQIGYAGDIPAVKRSLMDVASALGASGRGRALVADMERRLAAVRTGQDRDTAPEVLYITPGGVTAGPGTLIHALFEAAGLRNFQRAQGWQPIPLERLAYEQPDLLAPAFFEGRSHQVNHWTASDHPVARRQMAALPAVPLQGAWLACGGWFLVDAVEALAAGAERSAMQSARRTP
jgi:iron complex transport system substrate-binding protein